MALGRSCHSYWASAAAASRGNPGSEEGEAAAGKEEQY